MTEQFPSIHDRIMKSEAPPSSLGGTAQPDAPPRSKNSVKKIALWTIGAVALIGIGFVASQLPRLFNAASASDAAKGSRQLAEQANKAQASNDPFTKHALDAGAASCSTVYSALGQALTDGTDYMVQTQTAATDADKHSLSGAVGMAFRSAVEGGYKGAAAGLVFASPVAGGCEGTMVRVVPFAQSCEVAATFLPKGSQALQPLTGLSFYDLNGGGKAILMPSGPGCVAISFVQGGA